MGNTGFAGSVNLAVERGQYQAGETVTGYIMVESNGDLECAELIAHFHGEARTAVEYEREKIVKSKGGDGKPVETIEFVKHTAYQRSYIVEEQRFVARFPKGLAPAGRYQFPFQFNLHPSLPSSVYVDSFGKDSAAILYGVAVQVVRPGFFEPSIIHRANFDLIANVPHPVTPDYSVDQIAVRCCCCINKGSVTMSAALERNAFRANEPITVRVQFENQSTEVVQKIEVDLEEVIKFTAQPQDWKGCDKRAGGGMGPVEGYKTKTIATASLSDPIAPKEGFGESMGTAPKVVSITLPPFKHCTLKSNLIEITHTVRVRGITGFGMTNPELDLPVTLHRSGVVQAAFRPPLHEGEAAFADLMPYQPDQKAMQSPYALKLAPSAAVMPWGGAPQQQAMAPPQMAQGLKQPLLKK